MAERLIGRRAKAARAKRTAAPKKKKFTGLSKRPSTHSSQPQRMRPIEPAFRQQMQGIVAESEGKAPVPAQPQTPQAQPQPTSAFTQQLRTEQMSQSLGLEQSQQATNPFQADFQSPQQQTTPDSPGAFAQAEVWATEKVNQALGFVESLGGGDFQRGMYSIVASPLLSTGTAAKSTDIVSRNRNRNYIKYVGLFNIGLNSFYALF